MTEGSFFGGVEEEFEPSLGGYAVEHAGIAEVATAIAGGRQQIINITHAFWRCYEVVAVTARLRSLGR
jgi:hypothetical protein